MRSKNIDWDKCYDIDFSCPYCQGKDNDECEHCNNGRITTMHNCVYPLEYAKLSDDNKKIAISCGLFMFEDELGDRWMSLIGNGEDFSPYILKAYRLLESYIPPEWGVEWRKNYHSSLSEKDHILNAKACRVSLKDEISNAQRKLKSIESYLNEPVVKKMESKEWV